MVNRPLLTQGCVDPECEHVPVHITLSVMIPHTDTEHPTTHVPTLVLTHDMT